MRILKRFRWLVLLLIAGGIGASTAITVPKMLDADVIDGEPTPAFDVSEREAGTEYLGFLAVGDTGHSNSVQAAVVEAMSAEAGRESSDFAMLLGDNFYPDGIDSVDSPRWELTFEQPFDKPGLDIPFYVIPGNHDYSGSVQAQIDYTARSDRWRMPGRYHSFTRSLGGGVEAKFIGIDTERIARSDEAGRAQRDWLRDQLSDPSNEWEIVFGHRPLRSGNGASEVVRAALEPILNEGGADVYFAGHKHHLALLEDEAGAGPMQVISGAGSDPRDVRWDAETVFAAAGAGFVSCRLSADELLIKFVQPTGGDGERDQVVFAHTIERDAGKSTEGASNAAVREEAKAEAVGAGS